MKLFVYGTLKPDQPGFRFLRQIETVESVSETEASLPNHQLFDWDGLPIAVNSASDSSVVDDWVRGYVLEIETRDEDRLLGELDKYELGSQPIRVLRRLQAPIVLSDETEVTAWVYVLDDRELGSAIRDRLRVLAPISDGVWTMANDSLFLRIFPSAYNDTKILLDNRFRDDDYHVRLLGNFLVLYSCLERFGLHLYGPRRYESKDREPLQKLLKNDYFKSPKARSWFRPLSERMVFDSDTMTSRSLTGSPPHFWATIRNNSTHQGKAAIHDHTELLRVGVSTLGDFLALALINLDDLQISTHNKVASPRPNLRHLQHAWETRGFRPQVNALQNIANGPWAE